MWRRRLPRRYILGKSALSIHPIASTLRAAHVLYAEQKYGQAAEIFEQLAGLPEVIQKGRAPYLILQAGLARILNGEDEIGNSLIQRGFTLFVEDQNWPRLEVAGKRVVEELHRNYKIDQVEQLQSCLDLSLAGHRVSASPVSGFWSGMPRPILPIECPSCGGPIHLQEVEWVDPRTAVCTFCGGLIRSDDR